MWPTGCECCKNTLFYSVLTTRVYKCIIPTHIIYVSYNHLYYYYVVYVYSEREEKKSYTSLNANYATYGFDLSTVSRLSVIIGC